MTPAPTHESPPPVGTPLPLTFVGQAVGSVAFGAVQLHWIGVGEDHSVAWALLVLTVPLQAIAAVVALVARDAVAATGAGLLAGGWAATAAVSLTSPPGSTSAGLGVVLVMAGAALLVPATAGLGRLAVVLVLLLSACRFATTGIYELGAAAAWETAAGWVGLALSATSLYGALAFDLRAGFGREVLPIGHIVVGGR